MTTSKRFLLIEKCSENQLTDLNLFIDWLNKIKIRSDEKHYGDKIFCFSHDYYMVFCIENATCYFDNYNLFVSIDTNFNPSDIFIEDSKLSQQMKFIKNNIINYFRLKKIDSLDNLDKIETGNNSEISNFFQRQRQNGGFY